ncbi:hypothetical protein GCM10008955_06600 [Deinococcus malanensis]|uniref:GGDEF domain-containing protein n=1 Tax=Deinococcus malanensis TaxID=1706855 RepID=A0ABQ2ELY0_9DEIO|nr:hypothetical protein GCM10008955_06600 [Deinococcus malanensis]
MARLGGDEFTLVERLRGPQDALTIASQLLRAIEMPVLLAGREVSVSASVGVSLYPQHGADGATLQKQADTAMYEAKHGGKRAVRLWGPGPEPGNAHGR